MGLFRDNETNYYFQMEHNMVKNPNWKEVNQLAIFTSVVKDLKSGLMENESREQSEQDVNSGSPDYKSLGTFLSKTTFKLLDHAVSFSQNLL